MRRYPKIFRPVWAEVNLGAIRHNLLEVRRLVGPDVAMLAVVKAEAYGHGAVEVAKTALDTGASWLGVAIPEEGIALRKAGLDAPILVFNPLQPEQAEAYVKYDLTAAVCFLEAAVALSRKASLAGKTANVHVKVDTGMGRIGVRPEDAAKFLSQLREMPGIEVNGLFSHLATADETDKTYAKTQLQRFTQLVEGLKTSGSLPEFVHLANSAAIIDLPEAHFNMVRPGIMLYGLYPSDQVHKENVELKPALALKTRISFIKKVPAETGISYGQRYHTEKESTIVTIPIGYADGWSRVLTNKVQAIVSGKKYPIVGTICMDQCMIDMGADPAEIGQEVVLIGSQGDQTITADEVASLLGTINYEVTCMLSDRIPRVFV